MARPELPEETLQELEREVKETLDAQTVKIEEVGATVTRHHLRMGKPAEELVSLAEDWEG